MASEYAIEQRAVSLVQQDFPYLSDDEAYRWLYEECSAYARSEYLKIAQKELEDEDFQDYIVWDTFINTDRIG